MKNQKPDPIGHKLSRFGYETVSVSVDGYRVWNPDKNLYGAFWDIGTALNKLSDLLRAERKKQRARRNVKRKARK